MSSFSFGSHSAQRAPRNTLAHDIAVSFTAVSLGAGLWCELIILCPCGGTGIRTRLRTGVLGVQISPRILSADSSNQAGHRAFNPVMRVRAPYPLPVDRRTTEVRQIVALKMTVRFRPINPNSIINSSLQSYLTFHDTRDIISTTREGTPLQNNSKFYTRKGENDELCYQQDSQCFL